MREVKGLWWPTAGERGQGHFHFAVDEGRSSPCWAPTGPAADHRAPSRCSPRSAARPLAPEGERRRGYAAHSAPERGIAQSPEGRHCFGRCRSKTT